MTRDEKDEEADVCPHCGSVLDVHRALHEDEAAVSKARRHASNVPRRKDER